MNFTLIGGVALFVISIGGYSVAALAKPLPELTPSLISVPNVQEQAVHLPWPAGQGAIGTLDDGILSASSPDESVKPIASMTKLITALAVLDKQPMLTGEAGKTYTITSSNVANYEQYVLRQGTVLPVRIGQQLSQYQALQALLLPSANNIADMLVTDTFGSIESYTTYANNLLVSYGLKKTTVADASGFSSLTVSTPGEMFEIGRRALMHPVLAEIVAQKQAVIPGSGTVQNTNQLLSDETVIGIKTGTTDEAGSCLLFAFKHSLTDGSNETVIGAVMGVPNWPQLYREVNSLIAQTKLSFGERRVFDQGTKLGTYTSPWGDSTDILAAETLNITGWLGAEETVAVEAEPIKAPRLGEAKVGNVTSGDDQVDIKIAEKIEAPSIWWRLANFW